MNVKNRIEKNYNREATVIYPPVDVSSFEITTKKKLLFYGFSLSGL
jgi:hypothetical protein